MDLISPMLAEQANNDRLLPLCHDDAWAAEQKIDGHRLVLHIDGGRIFPMSRSGRDLRVSPAVLKAFEGFTTTTNRWVFDGEYLDGSYWVFDLVHTPGLVQESTPFSLRRDVLEHFWDQIDWPPNVGLLPSHRDKAAKLHLALTMQHDHHEGVIFRRLDAPYVQKRSSNLLKVKFRHDVDCIVTDLGRDGKANLALSLYDGSNLIEVAECTALAGDKGRIAIGDVVQVTYLYASADRRLVQPTMPRIRRDKAPIECTMSQLVHANRAVRLH